MLNWFMLIVGLVVGLVFGVDQVELQDISYEPYRDLSAQDQLVTECNVTGAWYNGLGSELIINVDKETGHVTGEFRTAVESRPGAAGSGPARVSGWTSTDGTHKTVALSVLWNNGTSTTAWTGLCHVCQGQEIMKTTWILTSEVDTCGDHWSSTKVGQDHFTRMEQAPGPRQHLGLHTPLDFDKAAKEFTEGVLSQDRPGI